ncbi:MAG: universal stress protein, partial [candidate division WOR-3 bacterium]
PTIARGSVADSLDQKKGENLASLKELAGKNPLIRDTLVEFGEAHQIILEHEASCNLIVMGTKGIHGLSGALVGSVTLRVLRKATVPVITVRDRVPKDIKKIVAATDTSEASGKALNAAMALAKSLNAEMIPLYIDTIASHVADGKLYWQKVVDRVSAISECKECTIHPSDSPVRGIVEFSDREKADLIAVGTQGLSGIREVVGSTAIGVMSSATVPVMVV